MRPILIGLTVLTLGFTPALIGATLAAPPPHAASASEGGKGKADKDRDDRGKHDRGDRDDRDDRGDRGDRDRNDRADKDETVAERVLTDLEQAILRDYFRTAEPADTSRKGLPPGLAKRDTLPPGLAMQLERNGRLPPGLEGRALPADLESRLPTRAGTKRVILDNDVVLIEEGTRVILDILRGAAGGQ